MSGVIDGVAPLPQTDFATFGEIGVSGAVAARFVADRLRSETPFD